MTKLKQLKEKAREVFNKWIRTRDKDQVCITCGGKVEHAAHLYSANIFWWLEFDEVNVNGSCRNCNFYGHPVDFDKHAFNVMIRHGEDKIAELKRSADGLRPTEKRGEEYYQNVINQYKKRCHV